MELVYDDKTGTWGEAPEVYGTIECATKEDYECAKKAIKGYKELESKHWDECRQIAHYDDEIKRLEAADEKHGRWISQGDDMWLCSNCKENIIFSMHESDKTEKQRYCCKCGSRMDGDTE